GDRRAQTVPRTRGSLAGRSGAGHGGLVWSAGPAGALTLGAGAVTGRRAGRTDLPGLLDAHFEGASLAV
ncbi:MAG: hypothetical protein AVDCRST_MAG77-4165, partial [uncultured Chloroflexi bacterium]